MQINPYLTFNGHAEEALQFYADTFGGTVEAVMRFSDISDGTEIPEGKQDRIAHGRVVCPGGTIMISDDFGDDPISYSGFNIQTDWPSVAEARSAYDRITADGTVVMPFAETFWAPGFGIARDKFGVSWMFNCEKDG